MLNLYSCVGDMVLKSSKASEFKPTPLGETDAFLHHTIQILKNSVCVHWCFIKNYNNVEL